MASSGTAAPQPPYPLIDIGANLLSDQFRGVYHGKRRHRPDLDAVLARAAAAGVRAVIVTASDLRDARAALRLCRRVNASGCHAGLRLYSTCGVHPLSTAAELDDFGEDALAGAEGAGGAGEADEEDDLAADRRAHPSRPADAAAYAAALRDVLRDGASDGTLVAVGECGLDFEASRLARSPRESQLRHFGLHIALAAEFALPLFLHSREAAAELRALLAPLCSFGGDPGSAPGGIGAAGPGADGGTSSSSSSPSFSSGAAAAGRALGGVVHSFDGSLEDMRAFLALGLYIGLNGCSLRTPLGLEVAREVPLSRLLLETDAPWCSIKASGTGFAHVRTSWPAVPKPERNGGADTVRDRSEPCHVVCVAEVVAACKGIGVDEVAAASTHNARALFGLR
jgi:TatD DNase family protein